MWAWLRFRRLNLDCGQTRPRRRGVVNVVNPAPDLGGDHSRAAPGRRFSSLMNRRMLTCATTTQGADSPCSWCGRLTFTIEDDGSVVDVDAVPSTAGKAIVSCLRSNPTALQLTLPESRSLKYALHLDFAQPYSQSIGGVGGSTDAARVGAIDH